MNKSTTPRHWALAVLASAFLLLSQAAYSQCADFISFPTYPALPAPQATPINVVLNASGTINLTNAVLNANGFVKNGACDYYLSQSPSGPWTPTPVAFDCTDLGGAQTWYVRVDGTPPGSDMGPGSTIRALSITTLDNIPPTIACPANIVDVTDIGLCAADNTVTAVAADNCSVTVAYILTGAATDSGSGNSFTYDFPKGTTTVTFTATDPAPSSSTATCAFTVTVTDNQPPMVSCPADKTVNTSDDGGYNCTTTATGLALTATDNCPGLITSYTLSGATTGSGSNPIPASQLFNIGTTIITYTADDGSSSVNCAFSLEVEDNEKPMINCAANVTVYQDPITCDYTVSGTDFDATASDNCALMTFVNFVNGNPTMDGEILFYGVNTIVWQATDNSTSMNTETCSMTITVSDNAAPTIGSLLVPVYNVSVTPGDCSKVLTIDQPDNFDVSVADCGSVTLTRADTALVNGVKDGNLLAFLPFDPSVGPNSATIQFPVGKTEITYIWTDGDGNKTQKVLTVNVKEDEKPVAKCKPGTITAPLGANGQAVIAPSSIDNASTDNCGIKSLTISPVSFPCDSLGGPRSVVLTVTDVASPANTATCKAQVQVVDNLAPAINCPTNFTALAGANCTTLPSAISALTLTMVSPSSPLTAPGQYKDNCAVASITYSLSGANFTGAATGAYPIPNTVNFKAGTTPVTYTFTDASGNAAVCSFNVSVSDLTAPVFSPCPSNTVTIADDTIKVNANLGGCTATASWAAITATDNCTVSPVVSTNHTSGSFFPFGNTLVSYTATDAAGNVGTCTFIVKVVDTQAPVAKCKSATAVLDASGNASKAAIDIDNSSTDNCFYSYGSPSTYTFNCGQLGPQTVTLKVVDGSGNLSTCTATITVEDNIAPVAQCASLTNVDLNGVTGQATIFAATTPVFLNNGSTDNCPSSLTYAIAVGAGAFGSSATFDCANLGAQTLTLRVTDGGGNTATCSRNVTVRDLTSPTFTVPTDKTIACDESTAPANTGSPTAVADACDSNPTVTFTDAFTAGICDNSFTIARTWKVTDASNNFSVKVQTITVQDTKSPEFTLPTVFNGTTDGAINPNPPFYYCDGPLTLELSDADVSDACATDFTDLIISFTVDYPTPSYGYFDVTAPVFGNLVGNYFPIGTTVVTFKAEDLCGNVSTHTVQVIIKDTQAPVIESSYKSNFCDKYFSLTNTSGACSNSYSWTRPNFNAGIIDDCSSETGLQSALTVTETIRTLNTVDSLVLQNTLNTSVPFDFYLPATFANFGRIFPTAQFPVGITTVKYVATDNAGNSTVCAFTVEVKDTQIPTLTCPNTQTLLATCPTAVLPDYRNLVLVSDNCPGSVTLTQTPTPISTTLGMIFAPSLPKAGDSLVVTVKGQDLYNMATCTFKVKLVDGQAPVPTAASLPALVSYCGSLIVVAPTATDPCNPNSGVIYGTPSTQVQQLPGVNPPAYTFGPGQYAVNWQYKDPSNNISFQAQTIKVFADVFPPVAKCKTSSQVAPLVVNLDASGSAKIPPSFVDNGSADTTLCDGVLGKVTLLLNDSTFNCADLAVNMGKQVVVLQVKDINGNTASCSATVQVKDVTNPILGPIPANVTIEACANIPNPAVVTASDQCPTLGAAATVTRDSVTTKTATGIGKYNYTITRKWTATDGSGNTSTGAQVVTIKDSKPPVFSASAPATVNVNTDVNNIDCKALVKYKVSQYVTDCATGGDLRVISNPPGFTLSDTTELLPVGSHTFIFTAKDTTGNISKDTVIFVVKDATLPTAVCINGVSAALQGSGTVVVTVNQFNNNSYDNCGPLDSMKIQRLTAAGVGIGVPTQTLTFGCPDADGVTQHKVKLTVKDKSGNESTCQTYIVIQDNVKPTITTCPASKTVQCTFDPSPAMQGTPVVIDNCTPMTPTFVDSLKAGAGNICTILKRSWSVSDQANNVSTCVQIFSIQDTIKPVFSVLPASANISCEDPLATIPTVTATDNCDNMVDVKLKVDTINVAQGACGKFSFTQKRTWTATDDCGNTRVHTQTIIVSDLKAPQFLGLPDTLKVLSASFPANTNCTVPVEIDLGQYLEDCTNDTSVVLTHNQTQFAPNGLKIMGNFPVGNYKLVLTGTDLCGNIGKDTVELRAIDNSKPTLVCNNNLVVALGTNTTAKITPSDIDLGSTDNCAISKRVLSDSLFDCSKVGDNTISMIVTDVNGNTNVCTVVVKVTLGNNPGLVVTTINGSESYFGGKDGTVSASATGGSGTYSYLWSANGATTATVANLAAGTYTVTVTDTQTQCKGTATATVAEGPKVTVKVGQGAGAQNAMIEVPVTVENFSQIYSFSFAYESVNNLVGTIMGTSAVHASLSGGGTFTSNANGVTWITTGAALTLPANAVLFNIKVQLTSAPVGSTTVVRAFDGTPSLEFQQDSAGTPKVTMVTLVNGLATINAGSADKEIGGDIQTWKVPVKPVPNVAVALTGSITSNQTTAAAGTYLFTVASGSNTTVACSKSTAGNQGITAADLLLIQNHIFGSQFLSPYQWIAANANNSGGPNPITLADYLLIQRVVLGTDQHILGAPDWKFIPKAYVFPTPNPLSAPFPQTIDHTAVATSFTDDDFVAVRMGDVNGNVTPMFTNEENEDRSSETFRFRVNERSFRNGDLISIPFKSSDFTERQAYQMTIEFDPSVFALEDMEAGVLPNFNDHNFGTARLSEGYLSTVWVGRDPLTLRDDEVLFTLTFRALRNGRSLAEVLRPGSQVSAAEAYDRSGKTMKIDFDFVQPTTGEESNAFALYQNQPNPFRQGTTIGFRLPETGRATLRVFNAAGQLVRTVVGEFAKGYNEVRFEQGDFGTPGVYYYELESADRSDRKKMVLMN